MKERAQRHGAVDVAAAVNGADHAVHAHFTGAAVHADFRNLRDVTAERFHNGDAARAPGRRRRAPAASSRCLDH